MLLLSIFITFSLNFLCALAQCGPEGVDFGRLIQRVEEKLQAPEPCECGLECDSRNLGVFVQPCTQRRDACDPCLSACGDKVCNEWVLQDEASGAELCTYVDVTPCNCCVQGYDYYLSTCEWAPVYNNSCDKDLCSLCTVTCGVTWCEWLDPLGDHGAFSQEIATIIRNYITIVLDIDAFSACVPQSIEDIIMKLSGYIALDKCAAINLSSQEVAIMGLYLDGGLGTPLCPCNCPLDEPLPSIYLINGQIVK